MLQQLRDEFFPKRDAFDLTHNTRTAGRSCLPWTRIFRGQHADTSCYMGVDPD